MAVAQFTQPQDHQLSTPASSIPAVLLEEAELSFGELTETLDGRKIPNSVIAHLPTPYHPQWEARSHSKFQLAFLQCQTVHS